MKEKEEDEKRIFSIIKEKMPYIKMATGVKLVCNTNMHIHIKMFCV